MPGRVSRFLEADHRRLPRSLHGEGLSQLDTHRVAFGRAGFDARLVGDDRDRLGHHPAGVARCRARPREALPHGERPERLSERADQIPVVRQCADHAKLSGSARRRPRGDLRDEIERRNPSHLEGKTRQVAVGGRRQGRLDGDVERRDGVPLGAVVVPEGREKQPTGEPGALGVEEERYREKIRGDHLVEDGRAIDIGADLGPSPVESADGASGERVLPEARLHLGVGEREPAVERRVRHDRGRIELVPDGCDQCQTQVPLHGVDLRGVENQGLARPQREAGSAVPADPIGVRRRVPGRRRSFVCRVQRDRHHVAVRVRGAQGEGELPTGSDRDPQGAEVEDGPTSSVLRDRRR